MTGNLHGTRDAEEIRTHLSKKSFCPVYQKIVFRLYYYRSRLIRRLLNKEATDPEAVAFFFLTRILLTRAP